MQPLRIGNCVIGRYPSLVVTHFPDGSSLTAAPQDDETYRQRALDLGYASACEMNLEHDPLHSLCAAWLGETCCPVLLAAARGEEHPDAAPRETLILDLQRCLNEPDFRSPSLRWLEERSGRDIEELRAAALRLLRGE